MNFINTPKNHQQFEQKERDEENREINYTFEIIICRQLTNTPLSISLTHSIATPQ